MKTMKNIILSFLLLSFLGSYNFLYAQETSVSLKVASYNLRLDTKVDSLNSWEYRKAKVNDLVRYHEFDLIGTQEGFKHQLDDMCYMNSYEYVGGGRDDGKDEGEHSAIIYDTERFRLIESGDYWLSETPDVPGKGWDATCCNRICSWAKFEEKNSGEQFYFFNVHFDHQGQVARKESGKLMVEKIKEIAGNAPVIATGDFNSRPDSDQIKRMSKLLYDTYHISIKPPYGPSGTFTRRFENPITQHRIDYIFVSDHFRVLDYAHLTDNDGVYYPSDHLPVVSNIVLK